MDTQPDISYDLTYLRSIDPADETFFRNMVLQFLEQAPLLLGEMKRLLKKEDWMTLGKTAHKLKADLACVGADALKKIVLEIETLSLSKQELNLLPQLFSELENGCRVICVALENEIKSGGK